MRSPRKNLYLLGAFLFSAGIVLGLILSGWSLWGQVEASLLVYPSGQPPIASLKCPLMLASTEAGIVSAYFDNPTTEEINPTVQAVIGRIGKSRTASGVLTLAPGQRKQVQWQVFPADRVFGGLILVNLFETSQRNFSAHQSYCGIPVWGFPPNSGFSGMQMFILIFATSLVFIIAGGSLWLAGRLPLRGLVEQATNASAALAVLVFLDMLLIFPRWWGLSLFLFLLTVMLVVIIITQFMLFPTGADRGER
jgi:hypothetical protein